MINTRTNAAIAVPNPPLLSATRRIGIVEMNTPRTGIKLHRNTIMTSAASELKIPRIINPTAVRKVFTQAIIN